MTKPPKDGAVLVDAIRATFQRRKTPLPSGLPVALTPAFADDAIKRTQWSAFVRKIGAGNVEDLAAVISELAKFIARPLAMAASQSSPWSARWLPGGPWIE